MRGHDVGLGYHAGLLADPVRIDAYDRALARLVKPGDVVLDVGTGTGILAMLAARHGAARVHAVESTGVIDLARSLVAANGLQDVVRLHHADIVEMDPIENVDLVVGDWLGRFVVDDEMLDAVAAAKAWSTVGTRWCPGPIDLHLGLLAGPVPRTTRFAVPLRGLDLSPALPAVRGLAASVNVTPEALATPPTRVHTVNPGDLLIPQLTATFLIPQASAVFALLGWWEAALAPGVTLSTAPGHPTHWGQIAWPVPPTGLQPGDLVRVTLSIEPPDWRWHVRITRRGDVVLDHTATSATSAPGAPLPRHDDAASLGREALAAGDLNAAVTHLGAALCSLDAQDPQATELHLLHGQALARAGLLVEAFDALLAARASDDPGVRDPALAWLPAVARRLGWAHEAERWRREHLRIVGRWTDPLGG